MFLLLESHLGLVLGISFSLGGMQVGKFSSAFEFESLDVHLPFLFSQSLLLSSVLSLHHFEVHLVGSSLFLSLLFGCLDFHCVLKLSNLLEVSFFSSKFSLHSFLVGFLLCHLGFMSLDFSLQLLINSSLRVMLGG